MPRTASRNRPNETTTGAAKPPSILSTAAITIAATVVMTGISMVFGGFGSQDAMQTGQSSAAEEMGRSRVVNFAFIWVLSERYLGAMRMCFCVM